MTGASLRDRAGGPSDLSRSASQPKALIPSAFVGLTAYDKHLATCGSIGFSGRRCGTTLAYSPRSVWAIYREPWFRFRNSECERICRDAWAAPPPLEGDLFLVSDERVPTDGWATRIYHDDDQRKCPLVRWEGAGLPFGKARFYHYDNTDLYQWHVTRDGFSWEPAGRLLQMKAQAIEARRAETGTGSVHESAVGTADAPETTPSPTPTTETDNGK